MNKTIRIVVLIGLIFFFIAHYLVMSIDKEYFPVFAYLYPFVAKVWFEAGRLALAFNLQTDITIIFTAIKYIFLMNIALALFAFKYDRFYSMVLWSSAAIFICYLIALLFLGLATIYPIYTVSIAFALAISLSLLKNQHN